MNAKLTTAFMLTVSLYVSAAPSGYWNSYNDGKLARWDSHRVPMLQTAGSDILNGAYLRKEGEQKNLEYSELAEYKNKLLIVFFVTSSRSCKQFSFDKLYETRAVDSLKVNGQLITVNRSCIAQHSIVMYPNTESGQQFVIKTLKNTPDIVKVEHAWRQWSLSGLGFSREYRWMLQHMNEKGSA